MITLFCIHPKGFNVGNEAIQVGLRYFLYEAFGRVVNLISLPAVSHYESQAKAGLTARTIREINQYGHGVIVGGGNLYENGELSVDIDALDTLEPPLMLYSLSRGKIFNRRLELVDRTDAMPRRVIEALNRRADYSLARDRATLEYLQSIGCDNVQLGGCPTLFLDLVADRFPTLPEGEVPGILFSIRNPDLMNIPLHLQSRVPDDIRRIIDFLKKLDVGRVRLLCHDHRDIPFAASFSGVDYVYTGDVLYYLALLRACKLNIGYRLHATLPCTTFGTPSIAICYDQRALSLMETVGLGPLAINMMTCEDLVGEIEDRYNRRDEIRGRREDIEAIWRGLYDTNLEAFKRFTGDAQTFERQC